MHRVIERWRSWSSQPATRRALLVAGGLLLVVSIVAALLNLPARPFPVRWSRLVWVLLLLAPASLLLSAIEYLLTAAIAGRTIALPKALAVSVSSSLANLLPLPGSYLVRAGHLSTTGVARGRAAAAPSAPALAWVGVSAVAAGGLVVLRTDERFWGAILLTGGAVAMVGSVLIAARLAESRSARWIGAIVLVELATVTVSAARYYLIIEALGFDPTWEAAALLAFASVVGVAAGIVPGGLGVREVLAGVFVLLTGMEAAVGVLAAATNRILGLVVLGFAAAGVFWSSRSAEPAVSEDAT